MKNLNRSRTGIAFPLHLIMMMWEFADSEKGSEHFVEGVYSMISYAMLKNPIIHTDMVRKNMVTSSVMSGERWKVPRLRMLRARWWQFDIKVLRENAKSATFPQCLTGRGALQ